MSGKDCHIRTAIENDRKRQRKQGLQFANPACFNAARLTSREETAGLPFRAAIQNRAIRYCQKHIKIFACHRRRKSRRQKATEIYRYNYNLLPHRGKSNRMGNFVNDIFL
jgi:hypothetical protein